MCRWLAYSGTPILIEHLLYEGRHSLIDQSLHSKLGAETTNGDGFGLGWYGEGARPASFTVRSPPGTTGTCASWHPMSARRSSSRTSALRAVRPCSRRIATRSAAAASCGCTTA